MTPQGLAVMLQVSSLRQAHASCEVCSRISFTADLKTGVSNKVLKCMGEIVPSVIPALALLAITESLMELVE